MTYEKIHQFLKGERETLTSPLDYLTEDIEPDESQEPHLTKKKDKLDTEINNFSPIQKSELNTDKSKAYGQECILDLENVPIEMFNSKALKKFGEELTKEIGMSLGPAHSWGDDHDEGMYKPDEKKTEKKDGISHIQFLWESSILIHALDEEQKVFVNVFSCKNFNPEVAKEFTVKFFGGTLVNEHNIVRK